VPPRAVGPSGLRLFQFWGYGGDAFSLGMKLGACFCFQKCILCGACKFSFLICADTVRVLCAAHGPRDNVCFVTQDFWNLCETLCDQCSMWGGGQHTSSWCCVSSPTNLVPTRLLTTFVNPKYHFPKKYPRYNRKVYGVCAFSSIPSQLWCS
jgi:hypothetical protein